MAAHFVPNACIVRLLWNIGTAPQMVNVIGATKGGTTINQTVANNLGTAIKSAFTSSNLVAHTHTGVQLANVGVRDYSAANQAEFIDTGAAVSGTGTGDPIPHGIALVVTLRTALAGQRYRGRIFLGGFIESDNDASGQAASALGVVCLNFVTALQTAFSGVGLGLAVLSHPADQKQIITTVTGPDGVPISHTKTQVQRPGAVTPVTGVQLRNLVWDSQRRRTQAGGGSTLLRSESFVSFVQ